ncbi:uncharacterized protein LOC110111130 [Dendrobium catenatum]|uniref:uncharacterized protein LOC110111130 n=1 Tax=Dendrobium catenatum TaxID=906689 RepID=UPI0009F6A75E|nr:uncharacterized protein LOC110111130 [Dendrobium catenatum]
MNLSGGLCSVPTVASTSSDPRSLTWGLSTKTQLANTWSEFFHHLCASSTDSFKTTFGRSPGATHHHFTGGYLSGNEVLRLLFRSGALHLRLVLSTPLKSNSEQVGRYAKAIPSLFHIFLIINFMVDGASIC